MDEKEKAGWLADKICNGGDFSKEAAIVLVRQADEIEKLRECLSFCAKLLWKLDDEGFIHTWNPEPGEEERCRHFAALGREAVKDAQALLTHNVVAQGRGAASSRSVPLERPVGRGGSEE